MNTYVAKHPVGSVVIASFDVKLGVERKVPVPDLTLHGIVETSGYQRS